MTEWRDVPGFEGRYQISDDGQVMSLPSRTWPTRRLIAIVRAKRGGYPSVVLRANNKQYARKVHRLVCEAFNGPAPDNVMNNAPSNLVWGTTAENLRDAVSHGTHAGAKKTHCKNGHPLSGPNLYVNPTRNTRQCRVCQAAAKRRYASVR